MIKFLFKYKILPLFFFLSLFLSIGSCEKESPIEQDETGQVTGQFFQYQGNISIIKNTIRLLTERNDSSEFISRIIDKYGYPLWNHTVYIHEEEINRTSLFVPFKSDKSDEVETIWLFRFYPNEHRYIYRGMTRKNSPEEDNWTFDYFTQQIFKKRPKSGIIFKHGNENDSGDKTRYIVYESACMTIECVDYYAGPEGNEVYKGSRCWINTHGGGGNSSGGEGYGSGGQPGDRKPGSSRPGGGGSSNGSGSGNNNKNGGGTGINHEEVEPDLEGEGTYTPQPIPSYNVLMITKNIDLNSTQVSKLNIALDNLIQEGCMQKALYDALVDKNVKLDFGMKTGTAPGSYNPSTKKITFNDYANISSATLKEELFHAWQDAYYPGGIWQYRETGKVNIEFEAKLYQDIIEGEDALCCMAFRGDHIPIEIRNSYYDWIESIRFKPDRSFSDSDYTNWLNLFNQYDLEYGSTMSDNLPLSLALRELIGNSNCY